MDDEILDTLEARKDTNCDYPWFIPDSSMIPADLSDPRKFMWFFSLRWLWNEQLKHGRMIRNRSWRGSSRSVWRVWRTQTRQQKWQNGMRFRKFIWKKLFSGIGSKNYGDRCIWMYLRLYLMHRMYMNLIACNIARYKEKMSCSFWKHFVFLHPLSEKQTW